MGSSSPSRGEKIFEATHLVWDDAPSLQKKSQPGSWQPRQTQHNSPGSRAAVLNWDSNLGVGGWGGFLPPKKRPPRFFPSSFGENPTIFFPLETHLQVKFFVGDYFPPCLGFLQHFSNKNQSQPRGSESIEFPPKSFTAQNGEKTTAIHPSPAGDKFVIGIPLSVLFHQRITNRRGHSISQPSTLSVHVFVAKSRQNDSSRISSLNEAVLGWFKHWSIHKKFPNVSQDPKGIEGYNGWIPW